MAHSRGKDCVSSRALLTCRRKVCSNSGFFNSFRLFIHFIACVLGCERRNPHSVCNTSEWCASMFAFVWKTPSRNCCLSRCSLFFVQAFRLMILQTNHSLRLSFFDNRSCLNPMSRSATNFWLQRPKSWFELLSILFALVLFRLELALDLLRFFLSQDDGNMAVVVGTGQYTSVLDQHIPFDYTLFKGIDESAAKVLKIQNDTKYRQTQKYS